jgi:hypothetical protein
MLINLIVLSITALAVGFVIVWLLVPGLRASIEKPKFSIASWDRSPTADKATPES